MAARPAQLSVLTSCCAFLIKGGTDVAQYLPASGQAPSGIVLKLFIGAMRVGNWHYDVQSRVGLLGIDDVLELWPDMGLTITPKADLGFWNRQHCFEKVEGVATPYSSLWRYSLQSFTGMQATSVDVQS